jgi:GT2 family glycosyltransferase
VTKGDGLLPPLPDWVQIDSPIPQVDVVVSFVLHHAPADEVAAAIRCVLASPCSTHVILVENDRLQRILPSDTRITRIVTPRNLGYGRAHNIAFALALGAADYHLIANSDVDFAPSVLPALIAYLDRHPAASAAAPRVNYPDGRRQATARLLPSPLDLVSKRLSPRSPRTAQFLYAGISSAEPLDVPFLSGCFLLVRCSTLERVGGFDPRFFVYGEDVDLSRRLHSEGATVLFPAAAITHQFRSEAAPSISRFLLLLQGYAHYFIKWGWCRDAERDRINRRATAAFRHL